MQIIERETMSERIRRVLDLTDPKKLLERSAPRDPAAVDRALTLSAAHRLIQSFSEQTQSRSELDECRDVMSQLERMVEDA